MLTWVDLETTGLEPAIEQILEIGVIVTGDRLEQMAKRSYLVKPSNMAAFQNMSPKVFEMHTKNGLLTEVMERGMPLAQVELDLIQWYREFDPGDRSVPLCGSTVGFDRSFLKAHMPQFEGMFHYRSIDISSVKELVKRWCPENVKPDLAEADKPHRVLADLNYTISEARWYYQNVFFTKPKTGSW